MKTRNNNDDLVTRGILQETLVEALGKFATRIETRVEAIIGTKIDVAIGNLAIMVEKGFQGMAKQIDERFEKVDARFEKIEGQIGKMAVELKETRKEVNVMGLRSRADSAALDLRVGKLEKKVNI